MADGGPTAGTIAWLLWGGTSGVNWAKKKSAAMGAESEDENCLYEDNEDEAWALATMNEDKWFCKQPTCEFCKL